MEILPECPGQSRLNVKHRPPQRVAQRHRAQGQLPVQRHIQLALAQGDGERLCRPGEDAHLLHCHLPAAGGTALLPEHPANLHGALLTQLRGNLLGSRHTLEHSVRQTQGEKDHAAHVTQGVYCAVYSDSIVILCPSLYLPAAHMWADVTCNNLHLSQSFLMNLIALIAPHSHGALGWAAPALMPVPRFGPSEGRQGSDTSVMSRFAPLRNA